MANLHDCIWIDTAEGALIREIISFTNSQCESKPPKPQWTSQNKKYKFCCDLYPRVECSQDCLTIFFQMYSKTHTQGYQGLSRYHYVGVSQKLVYNPEVKNKKQGILAEITTSFMVSALRFSSVSRRIIVVIRHNLAGRSLGICCEIWP